MMFFTLETSAIRNKWSPVKRPFTDDTDHSHPIFIAKQKSAHTGRKQALSQITARLPIEYLIAAILRFRSGKIIRKAL
jgi:hypothetical protein